ncbi:hypothetical protein KUL25_04640 [Rhodobacteraceae bacterium N5(2021)]|uniref:Uncharacterized protein n=1 Tax=Gymnodinialimonas phycosphaerae TaxID=2841589 RepID=A0A975YGU5_9RHOB|nr:hypothetical protein [Gymnodinialimonas phycosphaerae]MBY4892047.1 hypothetical protein [Gymnodinialimonas phycosphaerae]
MSGNQTFISCATATLLATTAAHATLEETAPLIYRGLCQMTETCTDTGACGTTPSLGALLLEITPDGTRMGRDDADLAVIEHFATLAEGLLPPEVPDFRRTFLVDLPVDAPARRFAVHVQTRHPDTGAPVLRPQYFVLSCEAL